MKPIRIQYHRTQHAEWILGSHDNALCLCDFRHRPTRDRVDRRIQLGLKSRYQEESDETIEQARSQLDEYLQGRRQTFDLPIKPVGSDFQLKVWQALQQIPYGETSSYLQLAKALGNPKAVRAVANANGANALAVIIPCHRIIGSSGKLVGYAGGLELKQQLLSIERVEE